MIGNDPQYQAWMQTVRQQMATYQQQTQQAMQALAYTRAPQSPASYGYGPMANPLLNPANNSATALFAPSNAQSGNLLQAYFAANAPGGNTIGLPGSDTANSSDALIAALLGHSGVG